MFGWFESKRGQSAKVDPVPEFFRACKLYCQPDVDQAIVVAVYNHAGLIAEKSGGAIVVKFSNSVALHDSVRGALEACEYEANFDYSDQRRSDWPAYRASGCKSIERFESEFIALLVKGVNEKNHFYDLNSPGFGECGLHLTVTVNASSGNYAEAVHYLVNSYLACKAAVG